MADVPATGEVKVILRIDTDEAKKKVKEVERTLQEKTTKLTGQQNRTSTKSPGASKASKDDPYVRPDTPYFKALRDRYRRSGGPASTASSGDILWAMGGYKMSGQTGTKPASLFETGLSKAFGIVNPFPKGGISGENALGGVAATAGLAYALYAGLKKTSQIAGLGLAYKMQSGAASVKTPAGQVINDFNSAFSYISNFAGSYKDSFQRLNDWDDAVASVTGRLPDTQFYRPKFQRQAMFERQFADMVSRNSALTRAGASGASSLADQIGDAAAQSMSR